jgi:hypothetical protein
MPGVDPRHSFGQFQRATSGQFGTGNGGVKLLGNRVGAQRLVLVSAVCGLRLDLLSFIMSTLLVIGGSSL